MADIAPFKGLRYNLEKVGSLTKVVAPPYDVINEAQRARLAARDEHNIVHLILPSASRPDSIGPASQRRGQESPAGDRYATAAALLKQWVDEGVLVEDWTPAIYVIQQEWTAQATRHARTGFIAAVRLEPFGEGKIFPHENTLSAPKADRLSLLKATRANLSQVFGIFPDDRRDVEGWLAAAVARTPAAEATDDAGVVTKLWIETDPARVAALRESMADRPIFIADGHHRYETALNYQRYLAEERARRREAAGLDAGRSETDADRGASNVGPGLSDSFEREDGIMMLCVAMNNPGLITLPTHRLLPKSVAQATRLVDKLRSDFDVHPFATFSGRTGEIDAELISDATPNLMIFYVGRNTPPFKVSPRQPAAILSGLGNLSGDWRSLDVSILQYAVLERLLGLTLEHVTRDAKVGYEHDADEAVRRVDSGEFSCAFILRPTPVSAVARVASHLEKMPPKSTFFYPKALTGMVIRGLW